MESVSSKAKPWERRLTDLWMLLERCHGSYMEPEVFRLNINQFLQTSRTVTFIIQKNKQSIPDFDHWYSPIVTAWSSDSVMNWAKNSRNTIEKEGDLDLHSSLDLTLFSSYIVEHDVRLETSRQELLRAGTKKLVRYAQKNVPSIFIKTTAIKIERRWVANTLPDWELLQACSYVYSVLYRLCLDLADRLGGSIGDDAIEPTRLLDVRESSRQVQYIKLSDMRTHYRKIHRVRRDDNFMPPPEVAGALYEIKSECQVADSSEKIIAALAKMASATFSHFGNHVPMCFIYDEKMDFVDFLTFAPLDQVDKYIFWRDLAERVVLLNASVVAFISEAWIRDMKMMYSLPMSELPIIGERLSVEMIDRKGNYDNISWNIVRSENEARLDLIVDGDGRKKIVPFTFAPLIRAFGLPYPESYKDMPAPPLTSHKRREFQPLKGNPERSNSK